MAYDLEEQEQLENLKSFWKQYGNLIIWTITAALFAYAAWNFWNSYQSKQAAQASQLYEELQKSITAKDYPKAERAASDIKDKFKSSTYATYASLSAAKVAAESNDFAKARTHLQWVLDNSKSDELKAIARLRLAGVALDDKKFDEGLKLLSENFPAEFAGEVADRKGDLLLAQNKLPEAHAAYQEALTKLGEKTPLRQLVQIKLDATPAK